MLNIRIFVPSHTHTHTLNSFKFQKLLRTIYSTKLFFQSIEWYIKNFSCIHIVQKIYKKNWSHYNFKYPNILNIRNVRIDRLKSLKFFVLSLKRLLYTETSFADLDTLSPCKSERVNRSPVWSSLVKRKRWERAACSRGRRKSEA